MTRLCVRAPLRRLVLRERPPLLTARTVPIADHWYGMATKLAASRKSFSQINPWPVNAYSVANPCQSWLAADGNFSSHEELQRAINVKESGHIHKLGWAPAIHTSDCVWREDAMEHILNAESSLPPTLFFGESNDEHLLEILCKRCNATLQTFVHVGTWACNCSGWFMAIFTHAGVAKDPPFWMGVENKKSPRYRDGVPLSHAELIPYVSNQFQVTFGVRAEIVIAHSGSWDSARACQNSRTQPTNRDRAKHFAQEWRRNASEFVGELRQHFPRVLWRAPNLLAPSTSTRDCQMHSGRSKSVCREGGRMYACNDVWIFHNVLINETVALMSDLRVPLIRWDTFLEGAAAGYAGRQIHPPASFVSEFANLLVNILLNDYRRPYRPLHKHSRINVMEVDSSHDLQEQLFVS